MKAFTLLEILIVVLIFLILGMIAFPFLGSQKTDSTGVVFSLLHQARLKSLAGQQDSSWGVYFSDNRAVIFKGESFDQRDITFDKNYNIAFSGEKEIVFKKITGFVQSPQTINNIQINELGIILLNNFETTERDNIDSRTVSLYYNNSIDFDKKIILNQEEFLIKDYLKDNVFYLGKDNMLITTLELNEPNTIFVIKRDRRFNDQVLEIYLEQDPGYLIKYSANGLETNSESLFVEKIIWE